MDKETGVRPNLKRSCIAGDPDTLSLEFVPIIYRIECSEEPVAAGMDGTLAGAVIMDSTKSGRIMPAHFQALLVNEEIIPLPHPIEISRLEDHNQTYLSASLRGMLLNVERRICLKCGEIFDAPRLAFSGQGGGIYMLLLWVGPFLLLHLALGLGIFISLLYSCFVLLAFEMTCRLIGGLYLRLRFSERQSRIARSSCPSCGATNTVSISDIAGKRTEIGTEGRWVEVSIAGKS